MEDSVHGLAAKAASQVIDGVRGLVRADGVSVQVRISQIKRDADITKPSMHEVLANVETQHLEPTA